MALNPDILRWNAFDCRSLMYVQWGGRGVTRIELSKSIWVEEETHKASGTPPFESCAATVYQLRKLAQVVALLACNREVPGSNID
jgi:two-component SAPR family response regulator